MKYTHWSTTYIEHINLEISYSDNTAQSWGYDCSWYDSMESLKLDMESDFESIRDDSMVIVITVVRNNTPISISIEFEDIEYSSFTDFIFETAEDMINGN